MSPLVAYLVALQCYLLAAQFQYGAAVGSDQRSCHSKPLAEVPRGRKFDIRHLATILHKLMQSRDCG